MATKKNAAVGQTAPTPASAPATGSITLPEMPPAEMLAGMIMYVVDTINDESKHLSLDFLVSGVQACIDATQASTKQMELAKTATSNADTATTGANEAAGTARSEASNLSALKEAVADATADAIEKTEAAEVATEEAIAAKEEADEAAGTARSEASNLSALKEAVVDVTADAIEKTEAAKTATANADTATTGANEAAGTARSEAENLSELKEAVAGATADAIEKTEAAETATGAANTATSQANAATADAIAKTNAAQTAAEEANAAKEAAIEATEKLTADVSALVLTPENKPLIQELAGNQREVDFGRNDLLNNTQLIELLGSMGAFSDGYWSAKVKFDYLTNPRVQTHSIGVLNLAGAVIECFGDSRGVDKIVRISTINVSNVTTDLTNCVVTYTYTAGGHGPIWSVVPMSGIDYSMLTEQEVRGEFMIDFDGVRRQVYTRTLRINYPAGYVKDATYGLVINGAAYGMLLLMSIIEIKGCRADNNLGIDSSYVVNINDILTAKIRGGNWGRVVWFYGESYATPCTITLNLKYTRL